MLVSQPSYRTAACSCARCQHAVIKHAADTVLAPQEDYPAPVPKSALSYHGGGRDGGRGGGRGGGGGRGRGGRGGRGRGEHNSRHGGSNKGMPRSDFERFG